MKTLKRRPYMVFVLGLLLGAGVMLLKPQEPIKASAANSNDKFSMATVPVAGNLLDTEAIFVLDHLTGVLRGGLLNTQSGTFTSTYLYNVTGDFNLNPATPEPKYSIVGGPASLKSSGGTTPAQGVLYVAELTSGIVIAYGFPLNRRGGLNMPVVRIDGFSFREAVGG